METSSFTNWHQWPVGIRWYLEPDRLAGYAAAVATRFFNVFLIRYVHMYQSLQPTQSCGMRGDRFVAAWRDPTVSRVELGRCKFVKIVKKCSDSVELGGSIKYVMLTYVIRLRSTPVGCPRVGLPWTCLQCILEEFRSPLPNFRYIELGQRTIASLSNCGHNWRSADKLQCDSVFIATVVIRNCQSQYF